MTNQKETMDINKAKEVVAIKRGHPSGIISPYDVEYYEAKGFIQGWEQQQAEIENLIWNLGGCSTYAMGYGLKDGHNKSMARPALEDVLKLALKCVKQAEIIKKLVETLKQLDELSGGDGNSYIQGVLSSVPKEML